MAEDQIVRLWIILGCGSLILLFAGALTNKITVYRDYIDLGWSLCLTLSPIVGLFVLIFISGDDSDVWVFATDTLVGQTVLATTAISMAWATVRTYMLSIQDNGLFFGLVIGSAKILIAVIVAACAIGLVSYLFRDKRKLGHVAIFLMLFAIFGWFINTLVNGERTRSA